MNTDRFKADCVMVYVLVTGQQMVCHENREDYRDISMDFPLLIKLTHIGDKMEGGMENPQMGIKFSSFVCFADTMEYLSPIKDEQILYKYKAGLKLVKLYLTQAQMLYDEYHKAANTVVKEAAATVLAAVKEETGAAVLQHDTKGGTLSSAAGVVKIPAVGACLKRR